jgi:transketolase
MVSQSLKAAEKLAAEGINATVVDMHTLKPLDGALVDRLVSSCGAIVTAEDHNVIGGLGGAVAEHLTANTYAPLERVGVQDRFGESGQADEMLEVMQISTPFIAEAAKRAIARKG